MIKPHHAYWIILVAFTAYGGEQSPFGRYTGPHSLGIVNLDGGTSVKSVLESFSAKPIGKDVYCFADKEHGLYLYAKPMDDKSGLVAQILLSSFPNCKHLPIVSATIDPLVWRTPEGIGIGSTKEAVIHAYHEAVVVDKLDLKNDLGVIAGIQEAGDSHISVGDSSYLYSCLLNPKLACNTSTPAVEIGFRGDKVIWISASSSQSE
jgi:hypothetical protein